MPLNQNQMMIMMITGGNELMTRNCKKCDIEPWCENKNKSVCVMELSPGDVISFIDSNISHKEENCIVHSVSETQNVSFGKRLKDGTIKETCGINGIYITKITREDI